MLIFFLKILFISLISTIIIEILLSIMIGIRNKKDILNIFLVNILTNPLLVSLSLYINIRHGVMAKNYLIIPLELLVVLTEGFIYKKYLHFKKINPYLLSFILNLCSFGIGEILNKIIY